MALLPTVRAGAEGTTCGNATQVIPDGRVTQSSIPNGATFFYVLLGTAGNSYSIEWRNIGTGPSPNIAPGNLNAFSDSACTTPFSATINTNNTDPRGVAGPRVSLTIPDPSLNPFVFFSLTNGFSSSVPYSFSATDTTQYSPAWSTNGTFDTFYSFQNTTSATCNIVLKLSDTAGVLRTTFGPTAVATGATASTNTVSLGTIRNTTGTAKLTHDCPPGGILSVAAIANFTISPTPYFQPVPFQTVRTP